MAVAFAALAVELRGEVVTPGGEPAAWAVSAIAATWRAAAGLAGWGLVGRWRFVASVTGGRLISTNTDSLWLVVGNRRFMPPVP